MEFVLGFVIYVFSYFWKLEINCFVNGYGYGVKDYVMEMFYYKIGVIDV